MQKAAAKSARFGVHFTHMYRGAHQKCFPDANFHRLAQSILLRNVNVKSIPNIRTRCFYV